MTTYQQIKQEGKVEGKVENQNIGLGFGLPDESTVLELRKSKGAIWYG